MATALKTISDSQHASPLHQPVMLDEVLHHLNPQNGGVYVDGTFGVGGYTEGILQAAQTTVIAIDRDPDAIKRAEELEKKYIGRLIPASGCFGDVAKILHTQGIDTVDGLVLDFGVSSPQIDIAERGFSFQKDGPLDMRMSQHGQSAADVINKASEKELADIIFHYGEEHAARRIAKAIIMARAAGTISTTLQLSKIVHSVLPQHGGMKTDTATKTFQALRIFVNDELGEIEKVLKAAINILKPGGRLVTVSFHSLEDSLVKKFLREHNGAKPAVSRHVPQPQSTPALFTLLSSSAVKATDAEIARNPRARSARLRAAERTHVMVNA